MADFKYLGSLEPNGQAKDEIAARITTARNMLTLRFDLYFR